MKPINECLRETSFIAAEMFVGAVIGYGASRALNVMNPAHGAVLCAISAAVARLTTPIFRRIFKENENNFVKCALHFTSCVLQLAVNCAASVAVARVIGYPIAMKSALILSGSIYALAVIMSLGLVLAAHLVRPATSIEAKRIVSPSI